MPYFRTTLTAVCLLTATTGMATADGHTNGATVISDLISIPEVGPDVVTIATIGGLLAIVASVSSSSTTN